MSPIKIIIFFMIDSNNNKKDEAQVYLDRINERKKKSLLGSGVSDTNLSSVGED
jgi:hypothetical protein